VKPGPGTSQSPLLDAMLGHAELRPEAIALRAADEALSYADLANRVRQFSDELSTRHVGSLGIALDNCIDWAIADLAGMASGVRVVPIPGFFSDGQKNHLLKTAQVDCVVGTLPAVPARNDWTMLDDSCLAGPVHWLQDAEGAQGSDKVTFTSGSSGQPKGVVLSASTIEATARGIVTALSPLQPQKHLSVLPFATLLENIAGLYAPLLNGSEVLIPSAAATGVGAAALDIEAFCALLDDSDADTIILVPQLLTALVTLCELGMLNASNLRLIAVGGGKVAPELLHRARAQDLPVCEGYGLSECCSVLTLNLPGQTREGSVGRPLPHAQIRVSEESEIEVRQPRMQGYLDQPGAAEGEDEEKSGLWYKTGDLGYFDADGYLYIDGRRRNVFITSFGRNVSPEWIEAGLTQHAAVAQALACGEARDHNLVLVWLRFPMEQAEMETLVATANRELPDYARIHAVEILEGSPDADLITSNGRLKRAAALDRYASRIEQHYLQTPHSPSSKEPQRHAIL
jgi:long-chain acyl-CoA synthetase